MRRLAQQQDRPPGHLGAAVEPPCRGQVEFLRIAAQFEDDGGERVEFCRLLRHPERVGQPLHFGEEQVFSRYAETAGQPRGIGHARLAEDFRRADPEQRAVPRFLPGKGRERQRKTRRQAGIARFRRVDLRQRGVRQTPAEDAVEAFDASRQAVAETRGRAAPEHGGVGGHRQRFGQAALDLRNLVAKGANGRPRHGVGRHRGMLSGMFVPVMFL
jgi:hypothetical protein